MPDEQELRQQAMSEGLDLRKSEDDGTYTLVDLEDPSRRVAWLSLEQVEERLKWDEDWDAPVS